MLVLASGEVVSDGEELWEEDEEDAVDYPVRGELLVLN